MKRKTGNPKDVGDFDHHGPLISTHPGAFTRVIALSNRGIRRLAVYLAGLSLFLYGLTKLQPVVQKLFGRSEPWLVIPVAGLPLLLVAMFELLPQAVARYKASRLRTIGVSVVEDISGYFRIAPYEDTTRDKQAFRRADNAQHRALEWIQATSEPILYLTGRSGTGKTSLMNAFVVPELRASSTVFPVTLRSIDNPLARLRDLMLRHGTIWKAPHDDPSETLIALLLRGSDRLQRRLLLIFDQFEETLIESASDEQNAATKAFIETVVLQRDPRLTILISIRDDFLGPLEGLRLPRLVQNSNWMNISAFTEQASRDFLSRSGLVLKPALLESVTTQARVIEDVFGLIRPVTLNIIGLVLSVRSSAAEGETLTKRNLQRMIIGYIKDSIYRSDIKPFAPKVLQQMYTKEGLKKPTSVEELARDTKLHPDVVLKTLILVSSRGLVQRLGSPGTTWQISHDFLVKLIREAITGWRARLLRLGMLAATPLLLLTWLYLLLVIVPGIQARHLSDMVAKSGGTVQITNGESTVNVGTDAANLVAIMLGLGNASSLVDLDLSQTKVTDGMLSQLAKKPTLRVLNLNDTNIGDDGLSFVAQMTHLQVLRLRNTKVTNGGVKKLGQLHELQVIVLGGTHITDEGFLPISSLPNLTNVYLNFTGVSASGVAGLVNAKHLQTLEMNSTAASDADIENIAALSGLQSLSLSSTKVTPLGICKLSALRDLRTIDLSGSRLPSNVVQCLSRLKHLTDIDLSQSGLDDDGMRQVSLLTNLETLTAKDTKITDEGLRYFTKSVKLKSLSVPVTEVTDQGMALIAHIPSLREVYVGGTSVSDVGVAALARLPDLRILYLRGCKAVTDGSMPSIYRMANLQTISLEGTAMTPDAIDSLIKARPNVQVERD